MTKIEKHQNNKAENKEFIRMLLSICIPITAQYFISALVNLIDLVMIGKLGDVAVASVGLSNHVFFNLIMLGVALRAGGDTTFVMLWDVTPL